MCWKIELLDKRMVLGAIMPQIITQMMQLKKFHQHQIEVNPFRCGNLRRVQPTLRHLIDFITVQHQVGCESVMLVKKDVLVLNGQKLVQGMQVHKQLMLKIMSEGIAAHHLLCLFVQLAIDKNQRLIKIERKEIIKKECYVFDFALNRALRQISDYSCRLNIHEGNPEKKVAEFINFLPVIAYDGSSMRQINAGDILDIAMAGTSATLLAKRWESVLLVNVDNETLSRLIANKDTMDALMKIEGFRSLNSDIETIIAKSEKVKKAKKEGTKDLTPKQKKELSDEEKEYKSKRKQIQEKLIKFATRIPVFMYLTDYRERCLKDVITQLEPGLFKKVTGLSVKDFELLVSLGVFNDSLMNDAAYKFKRYEDASLSYTGINRYEGEDRGGWDTVLSDADYNKMFTLQQASMEAPAPAPNDLPAKPYFTPDEDEPKPAPEKKPAPQPAKPIISYGGFTTKTNTAQSTQASGSKIHKPSNSYTPRPASSTPGSFTPRPVSSSGSIGTAKPSFGLNSQPAAQPKPPVKVDVSKIKVGVKVKHKAFGIGTVAAIQPDMVTVRFGSVEKKFLLPAAIVQGYLTVIEN